MNTVDLYFTVPVVVTVNLDTREVDRVRVYDESISADPYDAYYESGEVIGDRPVTNIAVEIVNEVDWPAWEVG